MVQYKYWILCGKTRNQIRWRAGCTQILRSRLQRRVFAGVPVGNRDVRVVRHVVEQPLHLVFDVFEICTADRATATAAAATAVRLLESSCPVVFGLVSRRGRSGNRTSDSGHAPEGRGTKSLGSVTGRHIDFLFHDGLGGRGAHGRVHYVAVIVTGKVGNRFAALLEERRERVWLIEVRERRLQRLE